VFVISRAARRIVFLAFAPLFASCGSPHLASLAAAQDSGTVKQGLASPSATPGGPKAVFPGAEFDFGEVLSGAVVEHDFVLNNKGSAPMLIEKASMTTPLLVAQMPHEVAPGGEGRFHFKLDTANLEGKFEGTILVSLNDPAMPQARLVFSGRVISPIELSPRPAFFVAGQRGRGNRADIEIVNHESEPLRIEKIEHRTERFTTQLETLKPSQRYRLTLALKPDGPGGKAADTILIRTSSKRIPMLEVGANTYLYERVHTFPDVVNFGTFRVGDAGHAAVILMIRQEGGKDFKVQLSTDVPSLGLKSERGPKGDQYQAEVTLSLQTIPVGPIKGSVFIDTNDREFPRVIVPVSGQIVGR
jgi:Protein of unknown function (DUF1573)